jgi:uncharacterized protein YndB with AHSA1/START domain
MTSDRRIEAEIEVPATPEEAWEAIATGPGITAWFMPAEVDGEPGGAVVHHPAPDIAGAGTVTAYDAPGRFAYEEPFAAEGEPEARPIATEFLVEARAGGSCVVRVVMSGFGDGEAWDRAIESFSGGWRHALLGLRLYLTHFRGQAAASVTAGGLAAGPKAAVWEELTGALGVPTAWRAGERLATAAPGAPELAGTVEAADEAIVTLRLDRPAPGLGLIGVGGPGEGDVFLTMRAQFFGPRAEEIAAREQERWTAFLAQRPALAR